MFNFLKKDVNIYAPVIGKTVSLEDVPDKMFAKKMLGDGIAFELTENIVYAPCTGKVIMIAETLHAIGIQCQNVEILIHIGLDTVNYGGKGFKVMVNMGDKIKQGQPLIEVDRQFFEAHDVNLITPMIITSKYSKLEFKDRGSVNLENIVLRIL